MSRDADVLEGQQRRVARVHAELLELLLADHAGRVHRDEEQREAVVAGVRVGLRHEDDDVGAMTVRDVRLRAVDDVLVAVAYGARLDAGDVRAGIGLGDAQAEDLLAPDRGHDPLLLLLLGAEREDRRHRHVRVDGDAHRQAAGLRVRDLLGEHERRVVVAALSAVGLGLVEAEKAELAHAMEDRVRERRLLPLVGVRRELLLRERADRLAQLLVLVGEDEVLLLRGEVGLDDRRGGGHGVVGSLVCRWGRRTVPKTAEKVNSRTSHFSLTIGVRTRRPPRHGVAAAAERRRRRYGARRCASASRTSRARAGAPVTPSSPKPQ